MTQRFYLGLGGKMDGGGKFVPEYVSLLDRPVDPHCYVDLDLPLSIDNRVPVNPTTAPLE